MTLGINDLQCQPCTGYGYAPCGECTTFCCWRIKNDLGVPAFTPSYGGSWWGNAKDWALAAQRAGVAVDGNPVRGAIACWQPGSYQGMQVFDAGHVAVVLNPAQGAGTMLVEQYNFACDLCYSQRTVGIAGAQFIHIGQVAAPPPSSQPPPSSPPPPPAPGSVLPGLLLLGAAGAVGYWGWQRQGHRVVVTHGQEFGGDAVHLASNGRGRRILRPSP